MFGLDDGPNGSLAENVERYRDRLPAGFMPIGLDQGGNLLTLALTGEAAGSIYFWDHEDELDDEGLSKTDMSNMYRIASDIEQLFER
jgi:hypothetical protein